MALNPLELVEKLTPTDDSPRSVLAWRIRVAWVLVILIISLYAGVPAYTNLTFVSKAAAEETHQEMQKQLTSISQSVEQLVIADRARAERERLREIREVREALLNTQERACTAEGELRRSLNSQVGELRSEYMRLTNEEFPPIRCQDLIGP